MTTEFNELLPVPVGDKTWIWIFGNRDQVIHTINEFYVKRIATDRVKFSPIMPVPGSNGKYMAVLER
jgi:hypothetical protein